MRAVVVAIACTLVALWSSPARAHVESQVLTARLTMPSVSVAHREDSRLGLRPTFAYYTRRDATPSQRLLSENPRLRLRLAEDPLLLSIDELRFHDSRSTLWGWPRQNPLRWSDPFGRNAVDYSGQTAALNALTNDLYGASAFFADRTAESWSQGWYGDAIFSASVTAATGLLGAASSLLPRRPDPGSAGAMMMCPIEGAAGAFANQLPGALGGELAAARAAGAKPISPGTPAFARALNQGTVKWVVTKNGDLVISPHTVNGVEISHAVLSGGEPVLAAGQAEVGVAGGQMTGIGITNQSGHFMPSVESTQIGREAFANHGIVFPE